MTLDPQLSRDDLELVALGAAVAAGLALLLVLFLLLRLRALSRRVGRLARGGGRPASSAAGGADPTAIRHVGVVRYDAFADMGGRLSFSAALFDDAGDGLVLSSINGRSETRTYAKALTALESDHTLSPEEQQAIHQARGDS